MTPKVPTTATEFNDVEEDVWYEEAVDFVLEKGLMNGVGDGNFEPNMDTTRGMVVTLLHRLEKEPEVVKTDFADVEADKYYADAVNWASSNQIVMGTGNNTFAPDNAITRQDMIVILYRYAVNKKLDTNVSVDMSVFNDAADVSDYASKAMAWAIEKGIIKGKENNNIAPKDTTTRAELAIILQRFMENMGL